MLSYPRALGGGRNTGCAYKEVGEDLGETVIQVKEHDWSFLSSDFMSTLDK